MAGDLAIRPLSLGEIVDRAVAVTRASFLPLLAISFATGLPALALHRAYAGVLSDLLESALAFHLLPPGSAARLGTWSTAVLLASTLLQLVATGASASVVAPLLGGDPSPPSRAARLRRALELRWRLASMALAVLAALALAALAGAAPGALAAWALDGVPRAFAVAAAAAGALLALLWAVVRLALAASAAGAEGLRGLPSLRRSARLMATSPGERFADRPDVRVSAIFLVTFLLALAVSGLAALPRAGLTLAFGRGGGSPFPALPLPAEVAVGLFEAAGNAVVQPFGFVALTVFYFDRRARREGLDLERWANALASPEPR